MRLNHPTKDEVRKNFNRWMKVAMTEGRWPPTEQGFDEEVHRAIERVATAWPSIDPELVANAKAQLEAQLDGTHARESIARTRRMLAEKGLEW